LFLAMMLLIQIAGLIVLSQGLIISAFVLNISFQLASSDSVESEGRQMKQRWKNEKNYFFCILEVNEERSLVRSWIRIHYSEVRIQGIWIRPKMSRIPNAGENCIWNKKTEVRWRLARPSVTWACRQEPSAGVQQEQTLKGRKF
jgi:hypothetical protein